jgi:phosphoribosylformylglycinamidine synthase PurS subunit
VKAKIYVTLKKGVLDPQGRAILASLSHLGIAGVEDVRVGKYMEIGMKDVGPDEARRR